MPFGPIPVIGAGAGAAAATQDQQAQQIQQQELLTRLIMQAQATQAQREWNQNYKQAQLASIQQARDEANANRVATRNENALKQIPGGSLIPSQLAGTPQAQDVSTPQMTLPASQLTGFSKIQGPDQSTAVGGPTGGGATTGESQVQAAPVQPTGNLVKIPSPEELNRQASLAETKSRDAFTQALNTRRVEDVEGRTADTSAQGWERIFDAVTRAQNAAGKQGWTVQQGQDPTTGKPMWVRVNKDTGEVQRVDAGALNVGPKQNATTDTRLKSAKAVLETGNDIVNSVTDPKIAAKLGPVMSRYNNLLDFVGNPPPEFAKLAGQIESYALANMGVHGMRSASGAEAIKQTIGLGRHTPESLQSVIEGLNGFAQHFMEDQGVTVPKPSGGGGTGGRQRVVGPNGETGTVPQGTALPPGWKLVQ